MSWSGITVYGTVDTGVAWQEPRSAVQSVTYRARPRAITSSRRTAIAPYGIPRLTDWSQSFIRIKEKGAILAPGWSFIFDLQAGFDPYSLQLANGPKIPACEQWHSGRSTKLKRRFESERVRFYNGVGYAGVSSPTYGTLTVGRQNSLTLDGVIAYDPQAASYAFSLIRIFGNALPAWATRKTCQIFHGSEISCRHPASSGRRRFINLGGYQANNAST